MGEGCLFRITSEEHTPYNPPAVRMWVTGLLFTTVPILVPRAAVLLTSATDRQLWLVQGRRPSAVAVMFVTVTISSPKSVLGMRL